MMMTVMMTMMSRFKSPVRPDWRCRGCVIIIIIMTGTMMVIIDDDDIDDDDDERRL